MRQQRELRYDHSGATDMGSGPPPRPQTLRPTSFYVIVFSRRAGWPRSSPRCAQLAPRPPSRAQSGPTHPPDRSGTRAPPSARLTRPHRPPSAPPPHRCRHRCNQGGGEADADTAAAAADAVIGAVGATVVAAVATVAVSVAASSDRLSPPSPPPCRHGPPRSPYLPPPPGPPPPPFPPPGRRTQVRPRARVDP